MKKQASFSPSNISSNMYGYVIFRLNVLKNAVSNPLGGGGGGLPYLTLSPSHTSRFFVGRVPIFYQSQICLALKLITH